MHNQKSTIKDLTHQMHVDAKANRTAAVQAEDAHQDALAALSEDFASEIDEAYAVAKTETEKKSWGLELPHSCRQRAHEEPGERAHQTQWKHG